MSDRIDKIMVEKNLVKSRSQAKMLIEEGVVYKNNQRVKKSGEEAELTDDITIDKELYVGRGAYKLVEALKVFNIDVNNLICADVGASTGGFTEVLLKNGASKVYAVDVGHDQLVDILKNDERVINMEGTNIKFPLQLDEKVDLCVVDLSFISLRLVFENIKNLLNESGKIILLIKPQFEVGREGLGKNGIVKNEQLVESTINSLIEYFKSFHFKISELIDSPILGKDGNKEYLIALSLT